MLRFYFLLLSFSIGYLEAKVAKNHPKFPIFTGVINRFAEPGDEVWLSKELIVTDWSGISGEICGYGVRHSKSEDHPFKINLIDPERGLARVYLKDGWSLEMIKDPKYKMEIYPYDCQSGAHGSRWGF
ncbi:hypothetical protein HELRODRAFT_183461 [Helobdella robusta]|uniref:Uncharacterized protein n=1 Tax=Helobdella robusta TaxID=6412 RepID=T1FJQ0_HELRO|nr:hypothetical protein HELRODRAFT_183461 [Helobdella robusta]ESO11146.1 hypothetical protein HELRODRAFT_183461 [Helobdella robusta]